MSQDDPSQISIYLKSYSSYASLISTTLTGASIGAARYGMYGIVTGGALGFAAGITDEILITNNISDKHYTSLLFYYYNFLPNKFISALCPSYALPIRAIMTITYIHFIDDFFDFGNKIDTPIQSLISTYKFLNYNNTNHNTSYNHSEHNNFTILKFYHDPYLFSFSMIQLGRFFTLATDISFSIALQNYNSNFYIQDLIKDHIAPPLKNSISSFSKILIYTTGIYLSRSCLNEFVRYIQIRFAFKQEEIIIDSIRDFLASNNARKILTLNKNEGVKTLQSLTQNLFILKNEAATLDKSIQQIHYSIVSLYILEKHAPGYLDTWLFFTSLKHQVQKLFYPLLKNISETQISNRLHSEKILYDFISNVQSIALQNGSTYMTNLFNSYWSPLQEANLQKIEIETILSTINHINTATHSLLEGFLLFDKLIGLSNIIAELNDPSFRLTLNADIIPSMWLIHEALIKQNNFTSSNIEIRKNNIATEHAIEMINKLLDNLQIQSTQATKIFTNDNQIEIQDYSLQLKNRTIVNIDHLIFNPGKIYAISGESGCGKSSVLLDIYLGVLGNLMSLGKILLPNNAKISFIAQDIFLPNGMSLKQAIYFPRFLTNSEILKEDQILLELLKELEVFPSDILVNPQEIDAFLIQKLASENYKLSGGQIKKIAIIQALISHPDILIMDESFEGIDERLRIKTQEIIKKHMQDKIVIVVDHNAHNNNYNNFYDYEVKFLSYKFQLLKEVEYSSWMKENEIGLYLQYEKLIARAYNTTQGIEILQSNNTYKTGISPYLYQKIVNKLFYHLTNYTSNESDFFSIEEKQELKTYLYSNHYLTKNTWISLNTIAPTVHKNPITDIQEEIYPCITDHYIVTHHTELDKAGDYVCVCFLPWNV